jgi:hypothetical protein
VVEKMLGIDVPAWTPAADVDSYDPAYSTGKESDAQVMVKVAALRAVPVITTAAVIAPTGPTGGE